MRVYCQKCWFNYIHFEYIVFCQSVGPIMSIVSILSKLSCLLSECLANYVHCQYLSKLSCLLSECWANYVHFQYFVKIVTSIVRVFGQLCPLSVFCQNCHVYCQSVGPIMSIVNILSKLSCLLSECWASYVHCQYFVKIVMSIVIVLAQVCLSSEYCQNCQSVGSIISIVNILSKLSCLLSECWTIYVHCQYIVKHIISVVHVWSQILS